jgi:serine/threonine protein kinase
VAAGRGVSHRRTDFQSVRAYLERPLALKQLKPELADDGLHGSRFHREAAITGQLEHPGIVPVDDLVFRTDRSQSFYAMRFVNGRTLDKAACEFHASRAQGPPDMTRQELRALTRGH